VYHDLRVVKNVTISMTDTDLAWVRAQAAEAGLSVSRWIAERVAERHRRENEFASANERIEAFHAQLQARFEQDRLAGVIYEPRTQSYREMINEGYDERFRRFDDDPVSPGSDRDRQGKDLRNVAEDGQAFRHTGAGDAGPE
jgi:hypothetical protein